AFVEAFKEKKAADRRRDELAPIPQKLKQVQGKLIDVRLDRWEVEENDLPKVCMRCGVPEFIIRSRKFSWHPEWIGIMFVFGFCFSPLFIVGFILSIVLTKRMKVPVSLCQVHRRHWVWRNVIGIGGLIVLPLMGVGGIIVLNQAKAQPGLDDILGGYLCAG